VAVSEIHAVDRDARAQIQIWRGLTAQIAASLCHAVIERVEAGLTALELCLAEVERIDSIGMAALHQVNTFTTARGVALHVVGSPAVRRALLDAELLDQFTLTTVGASGPRTANGGSPAESTGGQIVAATDQLTLRLPTREDLHHFDGWARDQFLAQMVGSYLLYRCRHLGSADPDVAGLIMDNPTSLTVLVEPKGAPGEPVGYLRLYAIHLAPALGFLETVMTNRRALRRGWGVEASRLFVSYAMDALGLLRVEAKVYGYNTPSINALARNSFQQEGVLRGACLQDGKRCDILVFSILEHEMRHERRGGQYPYMGFWKGVA
jgi:RimJ/RimL family protein N-acetyltransferase/anti-anti-sigma regulatory factor